MKYEFKQVPDPDGDGFFMEHCFMTFTPEQIAEYPSLADHKYELVIDHDMCAPTETWTLYYRGGASVNRSVTSQVVYSGGIVPLWMRDTLAQLVFETELGGCEKSEEYEWRRQINPPANPLQLMPSEN